MSGINKDFGEKFNEMSNEKNNEKRGQSRPIGISSLNAMNELNDLFLPENKLSIEENDMFSEKSLEQSNEILPENFTEIIENEILSTDANFQEVEMLIQKFDNPEGRNIEKLDYLVKQMADFIGKFENLENESVLEQFEKILYSVNNLRLELLEEISKASLGNGGTASSSEVSGYGIYINEKLDKLLAEIAEFKKLNNSNIAKVYYHLNKQIEAVKKETEHNTRTLESINTALAEISSKLK